ncbi:MAG: hypothetical protein AN484_06525 [Aphanizomenon flos-aquae WA102]|uniref:Glycosyltransferase n=1 Tax=Aphanizomenon flos-aquae WA102 TaxID=1710896 RepID=A0A1B7X596_APHFL|nr:MAG: hypothetical protein AN484_06525 [Aphanizomenon flos-aquae WA102]
MTLQVVMDRAGMWWMTTDIFIRSYRNDFKWLEYCLKSCHQKARGFGKIHIAVPHQDFEVMPKVSGEEVHLVVDSCNGYLAQQITKLHADEFCNADYILHMDSDCVWTQDVEPSMFFSNGKPIILREDGVESPWKDISAVSLGWRDEYEYMRRLPIIYPRHLYAPFRAWMERQHGMSIDAWIASQPENRFSEFNTFGQWLYRFHPDEFEWKHPSEVPSYMRQFWSWGGLDAVAEEINSLV